MIGHHIGHSFNSSIDIGFFSGTGMVGIMKNRGENPASFWCIGCVIVDVHSACVWKLDVCEHFALLVASAHASSVWCQSSTTTGLVLWSNPTRFFIRVGLMHPFHGFLKFGPPFSTVPQPFLNKRNRKYAPMLKTYFDGNPRKKRKLLQHRFLPLLTANPGLLPNHLGYLYGEALVFAPAMLDVECLSGGNVPKKQWTLRDVRFRSGTECCRP